MLRAPVSSTIVSVSVVVPTIGRVEQLRVCLGSLARCEPRADEVLVADQSGDPAVADLVGPVRRRGCQARALRRPRAGGRA